MSTRRHSLLRLLLLAVFVLGLTAAWRWSPLQAWLNPERLVPGLRELAAQAGVLTSIGVMALVLALAFPLVPLTLLAIIALGPIKGSLCLLTAALIAAAINRQIGRMLGHQALMRLAGPRMQRVSQMMERRGFYAVMALRLVPIAPFAVVNTAAGITHLRLRDMLLGSAIGMLPGTLLMAFFSEQIEDAIRNPGPGRIALVTFTLLLFAAGAWALRRWLARNPL